MATQTDFAGLEVLGPGESLSADNFRFQAQNPLLIDFLLRIGAITHKHDEHAALIDPTAAPSIATAATGGAIPRDTQVSIAYTWVDGDGGETLPSPIAQITTAAGMTDPQNAPTAEADYTAGSLLAANYSYALTVSDGAGGETMLGPAVTVTILPGHANARVLLSGLAVILAEVASGIGGAQWRLWRAQGGGAWNLIKTGTGATVTDDGTLVPDCTVSPPESSTATGTNVVTTVIPTAPPTAAFFNLYACSDEAFTSPCLIAQHPISEVGSTLTLTQLNVVAGAPPLVSSCIPGANRIDPNTDLIESPWKRSVANLAALPNTGNTHGDMRVTRNNAHLYTWNSESSEWELIAGSEPGGAGLTWHGPWGSGTTYPEDGVVYYEGSSYVSLAGGNVGHNPSAELGVHWELLAKIGETGLPGANGTNGTNGTNGENGLLWRGPWKEATSYSKNDAVMRNGSAYIAVNSNTGHDPSDPNLVANGGAESESTSHIEGIGGASFERSEAHVHSGKHAFKVTLSGGSSHSGMSFGNLSWSSGDLVRAQAWIYGEVGQHYRIALFDGSTEKLANTGVLPSTGWNFVGLTGTIVGSTSSGHLVVDDGGTAISATWYIDDVGVFDGPWDLLAAGAGAVDNGEEAEDEGIGPARIESHSWSIIGEVETGDLPGFFARLAENEHQKIVAIECKTESGECVVQVKRNGSEVAGLGGVTAHSSAAETNPSSVVHLASHDFINIQVVSISGTPVGLSFTIHVEHR